MTERQYKSWGGYIFKVNYQPNILYPMKKKQQDRFYLEQKPDEQFD